MIRQAHSMKEGAGAEVARLMPVPGFMNFDPFVLMDHFSLKVGTGFPNHPHRGFEAITYLFRGSMQHKDNLGNEGVVYPGGAQRFTAGSGIVHSEMPGNDPVTEGIQLWVNLPKSLKTLPAEYQEVQAETIPETRLGGVRVRHIVGDEGPVGLRTPARFEELLFDADGRYAVDVPEGWQGFLYVVSGELSVGPKQLSAGESWLFKAGAQAWTALSDAQVVWAAGQAHHEPIIQHGPYVD